jgi:hypothetical protein
MSKSQPTMGDNKVDTNPLPHRCQILLALLQAGINVAQGKGDVFDFPRTYGVGESKK